MANDESLLHPLIREGLPKARQRIKFYKEKNLITLQNGAVSLSKLAEQQAKDFINWQQIAANAETLSHLKQTAALLGLGGPNGAKR